jgi:hypothetical protein
MLHHGANPPQISSILPAGESMVSLACWGSPADDAVENRIAQFLDYTEMRSTGTVLEY